VREISRVILHCTATPDYIDGADLFDSIGVDDLRLWHTMPPPAGRGWSDVGYHYVIRRSGEVEGGRNLDIQGAHTRGHNEDTAGIAWVGTYHPTVSQIESIISLYQGLYFDYGIPHTDWYGHYEYNPAKECPGVDMNIFRLMLARYTPLEMG
jgi:N-acetylmuramoyl-L-alanine amidase